MTSSNDSLWTPLGTSGQLLAARYGPAGMVRTTVVDLGDGSLLVYSPGVGFSDEQHSMLSTRGEVRWLVAPNHFHNLGVPQWLERHPEATVVAADAARPRLRRVLGGDREVAPAIMVSDALPASVSMIPIPDTRQGELWIGVSAEEGASLIVGDALTNLERFPGGLTGLIMRIIGRGVRMNPFFSRFMLRNRDGFRDFAADHCASERPTLFVPCHGEVVEDTGVTSSLLAALGRARALAPAEDER